MAASVEASGGEEDDGVSGDPLEIRDNLVVAEDGAVNPNYLLGVLEVQDASGVSSTSVPVIFVAAINSKLLVAVPQKFWHKKVSKRLLPPDGLSKPVLVSVTAARDSDREALLEGTGIKVWLGYLRPDLEAFLDFSDQSSVTSEFPTETGEDGCVPHCEALRAVADERFAFLSAVESSAHPAIQTDVETQQRLSRLEEQLVSIKQSLAALVPPPKAAPPPSLKAKPKASPVPVASTAEPGLAGLDPHVVKSALQAGVSKGHLEELSRMMVSKKPNIPDAPGLSRGKKKNVLGESEEEDEEPVVQDPGVPSDPVQAVLVKLTTIVDNLSSRKKLKVDDGYEDGSGALEGASSSGGGSSRRHAALLKALKTALRDSPEDLYAVLESRMQADFGSQEMGPGEPLKGATWRGWVEHRSRIPNIPATVRNVWCAAGALDALNRGRVNETKARLGLMIASIDQLSVDRGQPILSAEGTLEQAPPFAAFAKHTPPDMLEAQHTRLWPQAWADCLMHRVRELDDYILQRRMSRTRCWIPIRRSNPRQRGRERTLRKQRRKTLLKISDR